MPTATTSRSSVGYWLVFKPSQDYELRVKSVEVSPDFSPKSGDGFLFVDEETSTITGVRRLYQEWRLGEDRVFSFDRSSDFNKPVPLSQIEKCLLTPQESGVFRSISSTAFDKVLSAGGSKDFRFLEEPSSKDAKWQEFVRELLDRAVALDLLGPALGPEEEIVGTSVRDRYLVGKISPFTTNDADEDEDVLLFEEDADAERKEKQTDDLILAANAEHQIVDSSEASPDDEREDSAIDSTSHRSLIPSSFGLTFCVDSDVREIEVQANWGRYDRRPSEFAIDSETQRPKLCWKRIPSGGVLRVSLPRKAKRLETFQIDPEVENVLLEGSISEVVSPGAVEDGSRLVTFFLVNKQDPNKSDDAWLFQPEIIVRSPTKEAIFKRRPFSNKSANERDAELQTLDAIYRKNVEFAVGHGIAVHAEQSRESPERATEIRTVVIPRYELPATETPGDEEGDREVLCEFFSNGSFDMRNLGEDSREKVLETLGKLVDDYERWVDAKKASLETPELAPYRDGATRALKSCRANHKLLQAGLQTLRDDQNAWDAFQFANRVMAEQRVHYQFATRSKDRDDRVEDYDKPKNRSWRPFQLAFILLTIPSLTNPLDPERSDFECARADLLWFPTGGGKTEAYMGVAAFAMAIRRLQGDLGGLDASRGLTVIMRYTLRLLTLQQFQRASTLTCALEMERSKNEKKWGKEPFSLGLWVGLKTTPNTTEESAKAIERERNNRYGGSVASSPAQLQRCPWCGAEIEAGRDVEIDDLTQRTKIYCGDGRGKCPFSRGKSKLGLPVVVVDEEIYRRPPSMLIATVDKFAQLAWKGEARTLFGKADRECPRHGLLWKGAKCEGKHCSKAGFPATKAKSIKGIRPPDLIIQDEFHLIGGALGTTVALYESAIDELCSWDWNGAKVRPKVVASTATTRKADEQTLKVFWRKVNIFPPSGSEIDDNYFSVQRTDRPGRRYVGICAPGYSRPAAMIRLYVAILTAAQALFDKFGAIADPYMTLVGYFNSLRELGGMRRLAEDDVQSRAFRVANDAETPRPGLTQRKARNVDELTSRVRSKDIPNKLAILEEPFTKETKGGKTTQRGLDVALATNMLSVGVDVPRLGVMVVNGQPKNTAEYIQATSRVGRACPGLVFTALSWTRPRDFSHYESFEHFHATFYKFVEAQSATPFAARALDRCLTGALVSLARDGVDELNANKDAENFEFQRVREKLEALSEVVARRAQAVSGEDAEDFVRKTLANRVNIWEREAREPGRKLAYERINGQGEIASLLKRPCAEPWDELTVATSMREVEPELTLVAYKLPKTYDSNQPQWDYPKQGTNEQTPQGEEE